MTRPLRTEADVLAAAQARLSRPSAERDAITALVHWRRTERGSADLFSDEWWDAYRPMRDAADRLIEVEAYRVTEAASVRIVEDGPVYDLPCGHTVFDACEACTPDPDAEVFDIPGRESAALAEFEAGVDAKVAAFEATGLKEAFTDLYVREFEKALCDAEMDHTDGPTPRTVAKRLVELGYRIEMPS
jgi:hypothetical protein